MSRPPQHCPLCLSGGPFSPLRGADGRRHFLCPRCRLIFTDPVHHLSRDEEAAHYRHHRNGIHDRGYVEFLSRVINPLLPRLTPAMKGLDYGCGPAPTLSLILEQHGLSCADYDPIFVPVPLEPPYDFLFATECFEHFCDPARELRTITDLLRPGGRLGIMTECWTDLNRFPTWYYTRDPTHVSFFHERTFGFICDEYGYERMQTEDRRVHLLRRLTNA